jgi:hypothetical protein
MKRSEKILLALICGAVLLALATPFLLESPCLEFDGCRCGRQREWACFTFAFWKPIRFVKFHTVIKSPGDPTHSHLYWDAQYERIGWLEFFRYVSSPINAVQPTAVRSAASGG